MLIIGIDPGITGAIAAIDHRGSRGLIDMPTMERSGTGSVRNQVSGPGLAEVLKVLTRDRDKNEIMVFIERVNAMPKQGVATMFSIGHSCGMIEGVVCGLGLAHQLVTPQEWKKAMKLAKGSDKNAARSMAQRLYPGAELHLVKHHNRAEAILIARYGYGATA